MDHESQARFRVRVSPRAEDDIRSIHQYIALDSLQSADAVFTRIYDMIDSLDRMPRRFGPAREARRGGGELRQVVVARYRIIYEITGLRVDIRTVRHASRLPARDL